MAKELVKFRNKFKKLLVSTLVTTIVLTSSNVGVIFANELIGEDRAIVSKEEIAKVEITDFEVKLDGAGRVLAGFGIDKEIDLTNILDNTDDILIKLTTKSGVVITKKKFSYDNYLNSINNEQYGRFEKVPVGYYTTVFTDKSGKLDGINIDDVQVELIVRNDSIESKGIFYGENMKPEVPSIPEVTKILQVTTNAPDQVLVKFDLSEDLDLATKTDDNIIIKAIDKNTGNTLSIKDKSWSEYLNNELGIKFGRGSKIPAGIYSTVFNNTQLEYITLEGVAIEFEVQKEGQEVVKETHGDISNNIPEKIKVSNILVDRQMQEHVAVKFDIDQVINLGLKSTDDIQIQAIDKTTGKILVTKNKTWSGYLNSNDGKFGLGNVLKENTYSTTFSPSDLRYTSPQDVVIKIAVTNNDMKVEHIDGVISENPESAEKVINIENLTSTLQGESILVGFEIDQVIDLKLNSKDNIIITAIDRETGDILSSKNKTWTKYLNDIDENKFGLNSIIKAGKYLTVFNEDQLRGIDPTNVIIEVKVIKEGIEYKESTEEVASTETVKIADVKVEKYNVDDVKIDFNIDKNIDLKLSSKDNIIIKAIDKVTGNVIKSKSKAWTDYLNNEVGEQFGLGELVEAGTYSNVFTKKQLGNKAMKDVIFEIVVERNGEKSTYRTGKLNSGFVDLEDQNHWANDDIAVFAAKGYISGYEDGSFRADAAITRGEFVKIVNKVFGFTKKAEENFSDVPVGIWCYDEILIAKEAGYINGRGDNTFQPEAELTRQEAAKIVATIINVKGDGNLDNFNDSDEIADWAKEYADSLSDNNIINGYDNGNFAPKDSITRGQSVTILNRAEKLK